MANDNYMVHKSFYGSGHDEYNFPLDIMKDSGDLLQLIKQGSRCEEGMENGAILLITEKQYIMSYNRGMGNGPHDSTIARAYANITDNKELNFWTVKQYCHKAEEKLLHARFYAEKDLSYTKVSKILSFSFNREKRISQKEFNSFMDFYNEYAWVIERENFKVSLMGKTMTIENVKEVLESMIDPNFELSSVFTNNEIIIGIETNKEENKKVI